MSVDKKRKPTNDEMHNMSLEERIDPHNEKIFQNPWDQLLYEDDSQYARFLAYLHSGKTRSVLSAQNAFRASQGLEEKIMPDGGWVILSRKNKWIERSTLYDADCDEKLIRYATEDQYKDLIGFRKIQRELTKNLTASASMLLKKAISRLNTLDPEEITVPQLPNYIRTAAQIAELASNAESQALALDEIVRQLQLVDENIVGHEDITMANEVAVMLQLVEAEYDFEAYTLNDESKDQ